MKIVAKAKPVKVRIISGSQEHSSLESLRKNFVWDDVKQLFDGSLVRWLRRIGANEIADKLLQIENPEKDILSTYNVLFRGETPFLSVEDVLNEYLKDRYLYSMVKELISTLWIKKTLKYIELFKNDEKLVELLILRIIEIAQTFNENYNDVETVFKVGKLLHKLNDFSKDDSLNTLVYKCFALASEKGAFGVTQYLLI